MPSTLCVNLQRSVLATHLTDEENEAQRDKVTCLSSHSRAGTGTQVWLILESKLLPAAKTPSGFEVSRVWAACPRRGDAEDSVENFLAQPGSFQATRLELPFPKALKGSPGPTCIG